MPTYAYTSGQGALSRAFEQLRRSFPPKIDAAYLKRFNIAPANESYIISIVRFLGLIDEEGNPVTDRVDFFYGDDEKFKSGLESVLRESYKALFDDMAEDAWVASPESLIHWFRSVDKTSDTVGKRQASTFRTLAAFAGHGETPRASTESSTSRNGTASASPKPRRRGKSTKTESANIDVTPAATVTPGIAPTATSSAAVGLTVRIEVNLPTGADAETYDRIFASIRKNLIQ